jgi:uncharacterized protein (DUF362 family)
VNVHGKKIEKADVQHLLDPFNVKVDKPFFIKPNLAVPASPKSGIVTDINLICALIDYLRDRKADKIVVGEGPVIGYEASDVFEFTGYKDLAKEKDVELIDLNQTERSPIKWHFGEISIPKVAIDSYYINVAKLKTHVQSTVTLSMKNQKGLLLPADKRRFHRDWGLHQPISYLSEVVKPNLSIIDGFIGLEGDGPLSGGKPRKLGFLAAGDSMLALDSLCCHVIGIDPDRVKHLKFSEQIGLGKITPKSFEALQKLNLSQMVFRKANEEFRKMGRLYSVRNSYACTGCGDAIACTIESLKSRPKYWPRLFTVFAYRALFGGLVILTGKNPEVKELKGKRLCIGDCAKSYATANGLRFVSGCPPKHGDIAKALLE